MENHLDRVQGNPPPAPTAQASNDESNDISVNAFVIVLMMLIKHMDAQQESIDLVAAKEQFLKLNLDAQKAVLEDVKKELNRLIQESKASFDKDPKNTAKAQEYLRAIQGQMARLQAEQTKLSQVQNGMTEQFRIGVDPAMQNIHQAQTLSGDVIHDLLLTQRTKS